jgi:Tfp pilus assembly major pilin PilA
MQTASTPSNDQIKQRALELWEQRGRPEGHDAEFWTQAERELTLGENPTAVTANATQGGSGSGSDGPSNA